MLKLTTALFTKYILKPPFTNFPVQKGKSCGGLNSSHSINKLPSSDNENSVLGWDERRKCLSVYSVCLMDAINQALSMNFLEHIHANLWAYCHFHTCSQEQNDKECYAWTTGFRAQNTWLTIVKTLNSKYRQIFSKYINPTVSS